MNEAARISEMILYKAEDGKIRLEVRLEHENIWLTQDQLAELFDKGRTTITEHIQNIFKEGELDDKAVCREFRCTGSDGIERINLALQSAVKS